jgi:DUF1680 family protein
MHAVERSACCATSGPRGVLLTGRWASMASNDGPTLNLYAPGVTTFLAKDGASVRLEQTTAYPRDGQVQIKVQSNRAADFTLRLRIPAWSSRAAVRVNGANIPCQPGRYAEIRRTWRNGDAVELELDMRGRVIPAPSGGPEIALARGPILLALDSRFANLNQDAAYIEMQPDGSVLIEPVDPPVDEILMLFKVPVYTRRGPSKRIQKQYRQTFCDYASAGGRFETSNAFRTWLPQPFGLAEPFYPEVWRLAYDGTRPLMPTAEYLNL